MGSLLILLFLNQQVEHMKNILLYTAIACSLLMFTACAETAEEKNSAVITITSPVEDGIIHHMDTVQIRGSIVSVMDLHGYTISIRRMDTHSEVFYYDGHYHGSNKTLDTDWPCTLNENVLLKLTITAKLDHDGNAAIKTVDFNCEP
jgi:hypothetical protein